MMTMYKGSDNAMNYIWVEDNDRMQCIMIDWDVSETEVDRYAEAFRVTGEIAPVSMDETWRDGIFSIRESLNGFEEIAWHV